MRPSCPEVGRSQRPDLIAPKRGRRRLSSSANPATSSENVSRAPPRPRRCLIRRRRPRYPRPRSPHPRNMQVKPHKGDHGELAAPEDRRVTRPVSAASALRDALLFRRPARAGRLGLAGALHSDEHSLKIRAWIRAPRCVVPARLRARSQISCARRHGCRRHSSTSLRPQRHSSGRVPRSRRSVSTRAASRGRRQGSSRGKAHRSRGLPTETRGLPRGAGRTSTRRSSFGCGPE